MRDLRDPKALGTLLLFEQSARQLYANGVRIQGAHPPLRHVADTLTGPVVDYDANPGTLEKYGDPRLLPSTLPN